MIEVWLNHTTQIAYPREMLEAVKGNMNLALKLHLNTSQMKSYQKQTKLNTS